MKIPSASLALVLAVVFVAADAHAADSADLLDGVLQRYADAAGAWAGVITAAASRLFWSLVAISMVFTFGFMALRKADLGEFFAEFIRFTIFTGFFWWLLTNAVSGRNIAGSIIDSMGQLASQAAGLNTSLSPSGVVDIGFEILDKVVAESSFWSPVNSAIGILVALIILVILALVGINMLLLLIASWVVMYAGTFYLGFGGSRWTSDMAINYYRTVLGIAVQFLTMVLLVGIGQSFLDDYYAQMNSGVQLRDLAVILIVAIVLLALVHRLPSLVAGIATGASVGGVGIGQFGAGAAFGAAGMAAAAATTGGAALAAGAASTVGGAQALMAAVSKASENVAAGSDVLSNFAGGATDSSASGTSTGSTPLAEAAGISAGRGMLATVGRITADATANLAKGATEVAKTKASSMKTAAMDRIAETTGGQIATAIRQAAEPTFEENSLAAAAQDAGPGSADPESEVAAFVNRSPQPEF